MGDASPDPSRFTETLLFILPFEEPKDLLEILRRKHPHIKLIYHSMKFYSNQGDTWKQNTPIPDGVPHIPSSTLPLPLPLQFVPISSVSHPPSQSSQFCKHEPVGSLIWDDLELFREATILCTLSALPASPDLVPNLKFIHFLSAGTDHVAKHPIYTHSDITLTTSSGIHGPMIAEWVVMQILSHSHKQKLLLQWQNERKWGAHSDLGKLKDAVGMRLGVLGYGSIGRQVARVCKAMGIDIIAYTASPRTTPESKQDTGYIVPGTGDPDGSLPSAWYSGLDKASLQNFLSQDIDILLVSVPLTKTTFHFLSEAEFKILGSKKNAFVVNISRGTIIDQAALVKYCKLSAEEGGLRGAALDVTDPEPLTSEDEIWGLENVAITPHVSAWNVSYQERSFQVLDRNLGNLEAGRDLINVVRRERGY